MIPNHILDGLGAQDRVAILVQGGELRFVVHGPEVPPAAIREAAARDGSEVLVTHMQDRAAILEFVEDRERDVGGEG